MIDHLQVRLLYERVSKQKRPIMAHLDDPVIVYIPLIRLVMLKAIGNTWHCFGFFELIFPPGAHRATHWPSCQWVKPLNNRRFEENLFLFAISRKYIVCGEAMLHAEVRICCGCCQWQHWPQITTYHTNCWLQTFRSRSYMKLEQALHRSTCVMIVNPLNLWA